MVRFIKSGEVNEKDHAHTLVINFEEPNDLIDVEKTFFVVSNEISSPMNFHTASFNSKESAENLIKEKTGTLKTWDDIFKDIK